MMGARGILGARGAATVRLSRHMFTDAAPKYRNSLEYVKAREKFQRCYVHDPPVWPCERRSLKSRRVTGPAEM